MRMVFGMTDLTPIHLIVLAGFVPVSIALSWIDIRQHRLPDRVVLPSIAAAVLAAGADAIWQGDLWLIVRVLSGGAILFTALLVLALARPAAVGGGDVKLIALTGALTAWSGWETLALGVCAAFLIAGLVAIALMLARRATRATALAFGPFLCAGAWAAIVADLVTG